MDRPIIVLGTPRSGSSMTAGIFAQHGVFTGVCRGGSRYNRKGFFENMRIRDLILKMHGAGVPSGVVAKKVPGFRTLVETALSLDGYKGGLWLWKGSALYWPAWFEFDPYWVLCRRSKESIFRSCRDSRVIYGKRMDDDWLRENIDDHHAEMDKIHGVDVDTHAVANGDFSTIQKAIESCGIEFNPEIARDWVEPSLWRH